MPLESGEDATTHLTNMFNRVVQPPTSDKHFEHEIMFVSSCHLVLKCLFRDQNPQYELCGTDF